MNKRFFAWILLCLFVLGLLGAAVGLLRGSNDLMASSFCVAVLTGIGALLMKKQQEEESPRDEEDAPHEKD